MTNPSILFATILVDELIAAGLRHVCLSPGSRNTPLVLAFAARAADITIYSHLDERSAGFFALGIALATDEPAAVVCTSGTAAANYYPAVIEAHQSRVPMLVLTADRPHELRYSGANQTIDQLELFGKYALWAVDMALPEANPAEVVLRNLRATASRAVHMATGLGGRQGVVHLNIPFRKPLEPDDDSPIAIPPHHKPSVHFSMGTHQTDLDQLLAMIQAHERGVIICGTRAVSSPNQPQAQIALQQLQLATGYPILADPISGARFGLEGVMSGYDTFMRSSKIEKPDVIIRLGNVPTSKFLNQFIDATAPQRYIHLTTDGVWADDTHRVTDVIHFDLNGLNLLTPQRDIAYQSYLQNIDHQTWQVMEQFLADDDNFFDGAIVYDAVNSLPENSTLFVGNSLPIRLLDQFGRGTDKQLFVYANRGASGIDGNISTALGAGAGRKDHSLFAIVGDITLYHDMNGLLAVHRCGIPITLILLNNNGGGIFHRLPIRNFDPHFTDYFLTPHGLDFQHTANLYGLNYHLVETRQQLRDLLATSDGSRLIEVRTDAKQDLHYLNQLINAVQKENTL